MTDRLKDALARIDHANAEDPRREEAGGRSVPVEVAHAERMTAWVEKLKPDASEALRVAARGQHVRRWTVPRATYPEGRGGYLRWREDLKKMHAKVTGELAAAAGYDDAFVEAVRALISKKNIKTDAEAQILEDALCLVFLETQFADLKGKTPDDKMREIVKKTWAKMGPAGRAAAQALPLEASLKEFLSSCLA